MDLFDKRYEKIAPIGRGAFAEVWQAIDTQTGVTLALKIFTTDKNMDEEGMKMLTREFALMIDADHRNLLRPLYFGISNDDSRQPYLTMPFCKNGNINNMIGKMTEREAWKLIRDTASALTYLHSMNPPIIHQDIKPANILIGNDGYYKLSDFGVSIRAKSTLSSMAASEMAFSSAGTISYMAPEKFSRDTRPIMANDIWSLGAMVYEMIDGDLPFGNDGGLLQKKGADIPQIHGDYSDLLMQTLDSCLDPEPWNRPLASKLEEIAIGALSKAPTIKMAEEKSKTEEAAKGKEAIVPSPVKGPADKGVGGGKKYFAIAVVLAILIGLGGYFILKPSPEENVVETTPQEPPTKEQTVIPEQESVAFQKEDTQEQTSDLKEQEPVKEAPIRNTELMSVQASQIQNEKQTPKPKTEAVKSSEKEQKENAPATENKPKKGNLSYGNWSGGISGGKPVGFGSLTFTSSTSIHCTNGKSISPQPGDKLTNAEFDDNGYLYQGTWIKTDGQTKTIMP